MAFLALILQDFLESKVPIVQIFEYKFKHLLRNLTLALDALSELIKSPSF